jgi:hypothetical protein
MDVKAICCEFWVQFIWLGIETIRAPFEIRKLSFGFHECGEFLDQLSDYKIMTKRYDEWRLLFNCSTPT